MSAREEILGRVQAALAGVQPCSEPVLSPRGARPTEAIGHFLERVADYRAEVTRVYADGLAAAVAAALPAGARVVVPPGLPADVRAGIAVPVEDDALTAQDLNRVDAVVTCCRLGIAETGTLVLDHEPDQGRRALTLVPDRHVCVVRADQIVPDVPDAMALLDPSRPLTWISGPSATSDIELERVEGVHGPRDLHVIVVAPRPGPSSRWDALTRPVFTRGASTRAGSAVVGVNTGRVSGGQHRAVQIRTIRCSVE